jgi:hypothetical protein
MWEHAAAVGNRASPRSRFWAYAGRLMRSALGTVLAAGLLVSCGAGSASAQATQASTYCNPLNLDYTYMIYNANEGISYRSGADPAVVEFRGEYYMFVTRSMGYWHSTDLTNRSFVTPERWYFQGSNAPAAHNFRDEVLYVAGDPSGSMSVLFTDDPKKGDWKATPSILNDINDPDLFVDDDGQAYMFWGSSNTFPIRGMKLDRQTRFRPGEPVDLFNLDATKHGWERFGENHADTVHGGYIEGPWMTKHGSTYYLQYAAPGTEFNVYGDGVYTATSPLGPYRYAPNNPISYKPGGFANGAGHGSTVLGPGGRYWHFGTVAVSVNVNWERRLCMYPTFFDADGLMWCDTAYGDYPRVAPAVAGRAGRFAGWMLLSYRKPVRASSTRGAFAPANAVDESIKTFWVAEANDERQWLEVDLVRPAKVFAVQVNFHDYESNLFGRVPGLFHRYAVEGSLDGTTWWPLVDRTRGFRDVPNDYVELGEPRIVRYVRYRNVRVPTPNLAISGLRIFGLGDGKPPARVERLAVRRLPDRRDAALTWERRDEAQGYTVRWGVAPDKLYSSWLVYEANRLDLRCLNVDQRYFFTVEAFDENGIGERSAVVGVD